MIEGKWLRCRFEGLPPLAPVTILGMNIGSEVGAVKSLIKLIGFVQLQLVLIVN